MPDLDLDQILQDVSNVATLDRALARVPELVAAVRDFRARQEADRNLIHALMKGRAFAMAASKHAIHALQSIYEAATDVNVTGCARSHRVIELAKEGLRPPPDPLPQSRPEDDEYPIEAMRRMLVEQVILYREQYLRAFIAEVGGLPSECVLIQEQGKDPTRLRMWIERRDAAKETTVTDTRPEPKICPACGNASQGDDRCAYCLRERTKPSDFVEKSNEPGLTPENGTGAWDGPTAGNLGGLSDDLG